eukprot:Opistho-1_new@88842
MRGQQQQALTLGQGRLDQFTAFPAHGIRQRLIGRAQPQPGQLGDHAAGLGNAAAHRAPGQAGDADIGLVAPAVGLGSQVGQPAGQTTKGVQKAQGQAGKDSEQRQHISIMGHRRVTEQLAGRSINSAKAFAASPDSTATPMKKLTGV